MLLSIGNYASAHSMNHGEYLTAEQDAVEEKQAPVAPVSRLGKVRFDQQFQLESRNHSIHRILHAEGRWRT